MLENTSPPLGLLPMGLFASQCEEASLRLSPGDRLYIYTDGIIEAANLEEKEFGKEQAVETLTEVAGQSLDHGLSVLLDRVQAWTSSNGLADDVSVLALEISLKNGEKLEDMNP
jgi:sigma-B regulation protein RsbU (phosphoserine phosphatase)